jgi:hypothetical protein
MISKPLLLLDFFAAQSPVGLHDPVRVWHKYGE